MKTTITLHRSTTNPDENVLEIKAGIRDVKIRVDHETAVDMMLALEVDNVTQRKNWDTVVFRT